MDLTSGEKNILIQLYEGQLTMMRDANRILLGKLAGSALTAEQAKAMNEWLIFHNLLFEPGMARSLLRVA